MLPALASAQTRSDVGYCEQLASTYQYYIGRSESSAHHDVRRGSLDAQVASTQCRARTADSIRVLEQSLRDGKVAIPSRG
jgi:hypothetical protein